MEVKDIASGYKLHWYYYSYITDYSHDYVDLISPNGEEELICEVQLMTGIKFKTKDMIEIERMDCEKCAIIFIKNKVAGFNIVVKKDGQWYNTVDMRLEKTRLKSFDSTTSVK